MIGTTRESLATRLISIGDLPGDDDDTRLRKHVGVVAGYVTIIAPLAVPVATRGALVGWAATIFLSITSVANLAMLARWKHFERYVYFLIGCGPVFVVFADIVTGGILGSSGTLVWAFLIPAYALLALGSRRATLWFAVFVATLLVAAVIDPFVRGWFPAPPYEFQLAFYVQNVGLPLAITFFLLRYSDGRRLAAEARSDELLTNAIPRPIATRLRHGEERIAEAYPATSVVFADIAGFTPWAQRTDPARVVALLDDLFSRLDATAVATGVEKIKTVGDAYMAAAGAPMPRLDHAAAALAFGRAALVDVERWRGVHGVDLQIRVGIASGPTVGGVIGRQRILFDLWGDTVNTAARMESSGMPGRIHLAASTQALLAGEVALERKEVEVKGLGVLETYFVAD